MECPPSPDDDSTGCYDSTRWVALRFTHPTPNNNMIRQDVMIRQGGLRFTHPTPNNNMIRQGGLRCASPTLQLSR